MTLDARALRRLLVVAVVVVLLGIYAFVLRGSDQPEDPVLGPQAGELEGVTPPGDPEREPFGPFGELAISVAPADGGEPLFWCLLAALNSEQRAQGMIGADSLQGYSGMVFVYPDQVTSGYHMRGVPVPLEIAWIDSDGEVVTIEDMEPCAADSPDCPLYRAEGPFQYAVETLDGGLAEIGITEGARVTVGGACGTRT